MSATGYVLLATPQYIDQVLALIASLAPCTSRECCQAPISITGNSQPLPFLCCHLVQQQRAATNRKRRLPPTRTHIWQCHCADGRRSYRDRHSRQHFDGWQPVLPGGSNVLEEDSQFARCNFWCSDYVHLIFDLLTRFTLP